ncbi:hypothetical protein HPB50_027330 [Hyalomma asiaticum]|uniref:Uncharacterized protein n=1 Tax=Hyalomma asiaticum TaxID=266040 RepID=A0ACB7T9C7_HYAAI|nr:hypothetical protein HPB50_027330 [Hyalomma asiaticum]
MSSPWRLLRLALGTASQPFRWLLRQLAIGVSEENDDQQPAKDPSFWSLFIAWLRNRTMEALLFAYTAAASMPASAISDIFREQSCGSLSYARHVCDNLAQHEYERRYLLLSEGVLTLTSAVVAILAGPVCDKYGHRTLVGFAIAGAATTSLVRLFLALGGGHMLAHVFSVLPMGLAGGHVLVLACCYYVVTKRTEARLLRTIRFYLLEVAALMGRAVGWLMGWLLHSALGHQVSLWTALGVQCFLLATLWASPNIRDSSTSTASKPRQLRLLVSAENAREAARMLGGHRRIQGTLKLLFALQALIAAINYGPDEILYPYARLAYGWTYSHFAIVSAVGGLLVGVIGVFAMGAMRVVGVNDVTFMNIGAVFGGVRDLVIGVTRIPAVFYISYILAVPQGVAPVGLKSYFSKLVPADESGKFMALVTACESVFTVLSRVALSFTFDGASVIFAGLPLIVCAALAIPVVALSGFLDPSPESTSSSSGSVPAPAPADEQGTDGGGAAAAAEVPGSAPVPVAAGGILPEPLRKLGGALAVPMTMQAAQAQTENDEQRPAKDPSFWSLFVAWLRNRSMEALLFAYTAAASTPASAISDIFREQSYRSLSYDRRVCDNLAQHEYERFMDPSQQTTSSSSGSVPAPALADEQSADGSGAAGATEVPGSAPVPVAPGGILGELRQ